LLMASSSRCSAAPYAAKSPFFCASRAAPIDAWISCRAAALAGDNVTDPSGEGGTAAAGGGAGGAGAPAGVGGLAGAFGGTPASVGCIPVAAAPAPGQTSPVSASPTVGPYPILSLYIIATRIRRGYDEAASLAPGE